MPDDGGKAYHWNAEFTQGLDVLQQTQILRRLHCLGLHPSNGCQQLRSKQRVCLGHQQHEKGWFLGGWVLDDELVLGIQRVEQGCEQHVGILFPDKFHSMLVIVPWGQPYTCVLSKHAAPIGNIEAHL